MERKPEEVLAAAFTLLVRLNAFSLEEANQAIKSGYDASFNLVDEKYKKLITGIITNR